jgi:hypothetical protein
MKHLNVPDLVVGGMLVFSGVFALLRYRTRRDKIVGMTYKQFVWCCVLMIIFGAGASLLQFIFPDTGHLF